MSEEIVVQVRFVLASFCTGMLLIVAYDVLRLLRLLPHSPVVIWVEDLLFWALASLPVFHLFLIYNEGIMRWYGLLGILFGALLQEYGISLPIRVFLEKKRKNPLQKRKIGV